jgi:uncharacterized membrane protein YbhN (UPF0104 family)
MNAKKPSVKLLKILTTTIALVFLAYIFLDSYTDVKSSRIFDSPWIILDIIFLTLIHSSSLFFVAHNWHRILNFLAKKKLPKFTIWVWIESNIYKYIPGNIANYFVRYFYLKKLYITDKLIIKSFFIEAIFLSISSFIFGTILFIFLGKTSIFNYFPLFNFDLILFGFMAFLITLIYLFKYKYSYSLLFVNLSIYYLLFFISIGFCAFYILNFLLEIDISILIIVAIYSFAWLGGFIIPGAPAGIGIRESLFVILSNGIILKADALLLILLLRFISICGEILLYLQARYKLKNFYET